MPSPLDTAAIVGPDDARFRTIFEQSPVSTQVFAPDGRALAVNHAWEELWGVTLEQLGPYNVLEDQQLVEKGVMPYILRGFAGESLEIPPIMYEPHRTKIIPGAVPYRWVSGLLFPVRNSNGDISEIVLMHQDITEQRRAQEALRESARRFRAVFSGAPVGISLVDREGKYLAVNPARQRMLGFSEAELLGKSYQSFTHPDDVEYDQRVNSQALAQNADTFQLEKRFIRGDGAVIWSRITAAVVRDESGEIQYSLSIAEDITDRKRAEEERARLFELEREARAGLEGLAAERAAILGQIAEGIIITDPAGQIVFVNRRAEEIHGLASLGIPFEQYSEVYHLFRIDGTPFPPRELPLTRAALDGETIEDAEWIIRRPDGSEIVAQGSAAPVVAEDGVQLGAVLTIRDVTAQHTLERQKDEFLSAVAHDLRTPLTTIKGRIQMLRGRAEQGVLEETGLREGMIRIEANATRMVTLINELLDVANIQIGRPLNFAARPTDLVELARSVATEYQQVSDAHTIIVETDLPQLVGTWDANRLERVLANLLSNAVKYSPDGGEIRVIVTRKAGVAILTVSDHGIGIPGHDLPYVFERFHRGGNVAGAIPGTGIGLAAVRANIEQHGGKISVRSHEGEGAAFTIILPL